MEPHTVPWSVHRARLERNGRRSWWLGFVGGLIAAAVILYLSEPIVTGQWHLL